MKLKILHIIDTLDIGGAERVVVNLANIFLSRGHEVGILVLLKGDHPLSAQLDKNVTIFYINRTNKFNFSYAKKIISVTQNYDIIHVHMRHNIKYLWYINIFKSIDWRKVFFHDHYGNIQNEKKIGYIAKKIINKSVYIGVSKELCSWSKIQCGNKNSYQLNNIIIQDEILNNKKQNLKGIRLLLVSNIHPRKNIEFAINIMCELVNSDDYHLDIIGQISDRKYYKKLSKIITAYKLTDKISFKDNCTNIQQILFQYDLALHTSTSETGPLVLIEYLAQSLPFVTYYTGEVARQIINDLPMMIIDSFDIKTWLDNINRLITLDMDTIRKKMGKIYIEKFSSDNYYKTCLNIYQENQI